MALRACLDCSCRYAVGLNACPQCWSTRSVEDGEPMPKNTVHGGPSNRFVDETAGAAANTPAAAAPAPDEEEEVQSSPGNSSETPSEKPQTSSESRQKPRQSRARTTASRSKKAPTASSSVSGTDGDPTEPTSDAD